jgi:hypothetical protein
MDMSKKIKGIAVMAIALLTVFLLSNSVLALTEGQTPQGPSQEEIQAQAKAQAGSHGPSAAEIDQFKSQFGGPPTSFPVPEIKKPQFEQPGTIPDEIKKYVSEKDIVDVYCAMTKWKSGQFFSAMDAVQKYVIEPTQQVAKDFEITLDIPDVGAIKAEGQKKINEICSASTSDQAQKLAVDFQIWGQQDTQAKFDALRTELQDKIKVKSDAIQKEIEDELQPFIDEQTASIESEIEAMVQPLVDEKVAEITARLSGGSSAPDPSALTAEVTSYVESKIQAIVDSKTAALQKAIQAKVDEIVGPKKAKFEKIGDSFLNVDQKINDYIQANQSQYDKYKTEAFNLRKNLVLGILDKNIKDGLAKLDAASADLAEAKKNDPTIKDVAGIKAELEQDRQTLISRMDAALEAGDENAFQQALNDFRVKWETIQKESEAAMQQSVSKVCTVALAQFDKGNAQMDPGIKQIKDLQTKCAKSTTDECLKVNQFSARFDTILSKFADLKTEMSIASKMCQDPANADKTNLIALMNKIQSDAEDVRVYGAALDAEKSKVLASTQAEICSQAIPQLDAAVTEIKKNDLTALQNNINNCAGKTTEVCKTVNGLANDFNSLKAKISQFTTGVENAKTLCSKTAGEEDFKTLSDQLNLLKGDGDTLRDAAQKLQAAQSEQMSAKILCRSVVPQMETGKQQISDGLAEMLKIRTGCSGKNDDRCKVINANGSKFDNLVDQSKKTLNKIADVNTKCSNASADKLDQSLLDLLDSIKLDKDTIDKMVVDLKDLEAQAGKSNGVTIEAEDESSTSLLPRTESWHSIKGKSGESWRPPVFGTGYWYLSRGGEYLMYNFTAPKDGKYNVWVRDYVDNFQPRGVRRIVMSFDSKNYGTFPETTASVPSNNRIGVFAWHKVGDGVSLKAGSHTMKIMKEATTSGAAILDSFYLTTGNDTPPEK